MRAALSLYLLLFTSYAYASDACVLALAPLHLERLETKDIEKIKTLMLEQRGANEVELDRYLRQDLRASEGPGSEIVVYAVKSGGLLLGQIGVLRMERTALVRQYFPFIGAEERWGLIAYDLFGEFRDQGFGTRALAMLVARARERLRLDGLVGTTTMDNPRSQNVMRKNGFSYVGPKSKYMLFKRRLEPRS